MIQVRPRGSRAHERRTGSVDTNRVSVLRAWFGDATDTPTDGSGTARIYPELNPEQQSGEQQLVASQGIKREVTA